MIDLIIEAGDVLDAQHVPTEGRILKFIGKDGKLHEIATDKPIPEKIIKQIPDELINNSPKS
jgi:hypothetical protein